MNRVVIQIMLFMHSASDALVRDFQRSGRMILIGGDWNAEVRSTVGEVGRGQVVNYANECGNATGEWLMSWGGHHNLQLVNTILKKPWEKRSTHLQAGRKIMLDYVVIDR